MNSDRRLTIRTAAIVAVIYLVVTGSAFLYIHHSDSVQKARQQQQAQVEKERQQRQGQILERKLCTTFAGLASLKPPAGNPQTNPSRAYLQQEHAKLVQLGTDLGCRQA